MEKKAVEHAKLHWNDAGTPVSDHFDDVYFSNINGLEETRYVFLTQNQLPARWLAPDAPARFVIAETGFGTGLNFLATWQAFREFRNTHQESPITQLHFISFEKYPIHPDDLKQAHAAWPELKQEATQLRQHYPCAIAGCHRLVLADGMITLDLWFGDVKQNLPQLYAGAHGIVDCWYLDGFAPSKNPHMWDNTLFTQMVRLGRKNCTFATFTSAGMVRRGLIDAGFEVKKIKGFGTKREMLIGQLAHKEISAPQSPFVFEPASCHRDVAIIGGGVASACLALALARRGVKVSLYCEDEKAALGASGNRQGALYPLLNGHDTLLSHFFANAFVFARQFLDQAAERITFDHQWCGVTQLAFDEKTALKQQKMLATDLACHLVEPLTAAQTNAITGLDINLSSVHYPLGGWLCPQQLTQGIWRTLEQHHHATIRFLTPIIALHPSENAWHLETYQGFKKHDVVVIANGHKFTQFSQAAAIPAYPVRGQVTHVPTNSQLARLNCVLCYDGYLTPINEQSASHCIGASYARNDCSLDFKQHDQQENKDKLTRCLDSDWAQTLDVDHQQARVGIRSASRDHLPFVGNLCRAPADLESTQSSALESYPNLYALLALGSRGLTTAPLLGELIASQICGEPLPLPLSQLEALHPARGWMKKFTKQKKSD